MSNNAVMIIGGGYEAINASIVLTSLDIKVTLLSPKSHIEDTLNHYRFERQMVSFWDLYNKENKINLGFEPIEDIKKILSNEQNNHETVWIFLDDITKEKKKELQQLLDSPHLKIILSGITKIGKASEFAESLNTKWVYYFPLISVKDGENLTSLLRPEVVLIGEKTKDSYQYSDILRYFISNSCHHYFATISEVEFARSTLMAMLATRISFMNETARLADAVGVNIHQVQNMIGLDNRIGKGYLSASWGFGGHALPTELSLLTQSYEQYNVKGLITQSVAKINEDQKELIFRKFWRHFDGFIENKSVLIWGAGYRSGTGRTTNSAIHPLLKLLWSYHIKTLVFTTNTGFELEESYGKNPLFLVVTDAYENLNQVDALFIINWSSIVKPDIHALNKVAIPVFDGKNVLDDNLKNQLIGQYYGIGR